MRQRRNVAVGSWPICCCVEGASGLLWERPSAGVLRINVDGAMAEGQGGCATVARDDRGRFLGALAVLLIEVGEMDYAEAKVAL
ncbi:hypothetical protein M9H77_25047 [Catharanthus roseus]|uniref:Uncharacterized protein n=1 Tax=Catharanthus roseus TaxID=4058 RepID=A0ACC0A6M2_CATRO|nr:hypothetical protein M9H77_25047 [Catharanthus roseus]